MTQTATPKMLDLSKFEVHDAVKAAIEAAATMGASDLFVVCNEAFTGIHVRHLGMVRLLSIVGLDQGKRFQAHIRAMAHMDMNEKRRPQDGRWIHETEEGQSVDLRINTMPTMYGEDFAIRLLVRQNQLMALENLGFVATQYAAVQNMIDSPSGLILITGPTGSGKTATLYAALAGLNDGTRKINTIEDPIEYAVEGLRQSQINQAIDLSFALLLRAVLRQSPDVIMIGEVRDAETAETAVRAANSGHMVFSTLHAPVASAGVQSMRSLGVHPHFLSTALRGILAQRLARTLCAQCRTSFDLTDAPHTFDEVRPWLKDGEGKILYAAKGCEACQMVGYAGRTAVYEILDVSGEVRRMIADGGTAQEIKLKAIEQGMIEFRKAALLKVALGQTSTEEVFRVIPSEHLTDET